MIVSELEDCIYAGSKYKENGKECIHVDVRLHIGKGIVIQFRLNSISEKYHFPTIKGYNSGKSTYRENLRND